MEEHNDDHANISIGFNSEVKISVMKNNYRVLTTISSSDNHVLRFELTLSAFRQLVAEYKHFI